MTSTTSDSRLFDQSEDSLDEVEYICIAADILQEMFSALESLAAGNRGLALALTNRGPDARDGLSRLEEAVELLTRIDDRVLAIQLRRRATALISRLSDEIDELTLRATSEECPVDAFSIALH